jgi:RHS repeat-associated protein
MRKFYSLRGVVAALLIMLPIHSFADNKDKQEAAPATEEKSNLVEKTKPNKAVEGGKEELSLAKTNEMALAGFDLGDIGGGGGGSAPMAEANHIAKSSEITELDSKMKPQSFDMFGDSIDTYTGGLSFSHTDVSLPGNSNLEVAIHRTIGQSTKYHPQQSAGFGDWELEVPRIYRKVAQPVKYNSHGFVNTEKIGSYVVQFGREAPTWRNQRCSSRDSEGPYYQMPSQWVDTNGKNITQAWKTYSIVPEWFYGEETYADGTHLAIPGQGTQEILDTPTGSIWNGSYKKVTKNHWKFECINTINGGGEGFIAIAPNGDRWTFDKLVYRQAPYLKVKPAAGAFSAIYSITGASYATILATSVTDVNGNVVNYTYTSDGKLTKIEATDGRKIVINYSGSDVGSVVANGRTWTYSYKPSTAVRPQVLQQVTLPDNREWEFNLDFLYFQADTGKACNISDFNVSLTHPNGASATFELSETQRPAPTRVEGKRNGRCRYDPTTAGWAYTSGWDRIYETISVTEKEITGASIPTSLWRYSYSGANVTVTHPLDKKVDFEFYTSGAGEGKAKYKRTYAGSTLKQTEYSRYIETQPLGQTFRNAIQTMHYKGDSKISLLAESRLTRESTTYYTINTYNTNLNSSTYSYGKPTKIEQYSDLQGHGIKRTTETTYSNNKTKWILGLPSIVKRNNKEFERYGYDPLGRNVWLKRFGVPTITRTFDTVGNITSVKDAEENKTKYSSYRAGKAEHIIRADDEVVRRNYNYHGWLKSQTAPNNITTKYDYDGMGRLTLIDRPDNWTDTSVKFPGLIQEVIFGKTTTETTYDELLRPLLRKTYPTSGGGKTTYVKSSYDALGRASFTSLPTTSSNPTAGKNTTYDVLGRVTKTKDTIHPYAETRTTYTTNNTRYVYDEKNYATKMVSSGYGSPEDGNPTLIDSPYDINTAMTYDIWGNVKTVRQYGTHNGFNVNFTQSYFYDNNLRLCRLRTPETGDTAYNYYKTGHLKQTAAGLSSSNNCAAPSGSTLKTLNYTSLNQLETETYASSATPNTYYTFNELGNLLTLNRGNANWSYVYDSFQNLTSETLKLDGYTWATSYGYSNEKYLTSITLPSGRNVSYSFNGLGQTLSAYSSGQAVATNFEYHANGNWYRIKYANGHNNYQTLTSRQLPLRVWTSHSSKPKVIDYNHLYDKSRNITTIVDSVDNSNNRTFSYDALHRLTAASGAFGNSSFVYDAVGNIRKKTIGTRVVNILYDGQKNRVSSANSNGGGIPTATSSTFNHGYYYDSRGNTTNSGKVSFQYDLENQPISMNHGSGSSSFKYDGHKRRVKQIVSTNSGIKATYSVYSIGGVLLHRHNVTDNVKTDYLPIGGSNTASVRIKNNSLFFQHLDHLGSPVAETNSSGDIRWRERYTPFGEKLDNPDENKNNQGYSGHITDDATGLVYMQARYYDPVIGRFYSNDPVDVLGHIGHGNLVHGFNRYTYANNNPYKYVDPDGELGLLVTSFLAGALNAGIEYATNDKASGKDLFVAFGKGAVMGLTGAGAINVMDKAMKLATATSKAGKGFAKAYAGASAVLPTSIAVDTATNMMGITDISPLDSTINGIANALGSGSGAQVTNLTKGVIKDSVSGTIGEVTSAGTAKVADDNLKNVVD